MTTESSTEIYRLRSGSGSISSNLIRPKLTVKQSTTNINDQITPSKNRKKNKSKTKERNSSSIREKYPNDPAYTEDVRHLALPSRRNSGPELDLARMKPAKRPTRLDLDKSNTFDGRLSRRTKATATQPSNSKHLSSNNNVLDINAVSSSSENNLDEEIVFLTMKRGQSLDRRGFSMDYLEQKRLSWFQKEFLRGQTWDRGQPHQQQQQQQKTNKKIVRQNATRTNSSTPPPDEIYNKRGSGGGGGAGKQKSTDKKHKGESKLQIGKRFLRGEIGIKSFNYYLIKEGLKSSSTSSTKKSKKGKGISKSEENIYEEIYFTDKPVSPDEDIIQQQQQRYRTGSGGVGGYPPQQSMEHHYEPLKQKNIESTYQPLVPTSTNDSTNINYVDCALCIEQCTDKNCDICAKQRQLQDYSTNYSNYVQTYALLRENEKNQFNAYSQQQQQQQVQPPQPVLQYQSYNPSNPNVYKIETTPVAFPSDYQPVNYVEIQAPPPQPVYYPPPQMTFNPVYGYETIRQGKSSSSTDSLQHQKRIYSEPVYQMPDYSYYAPPKYDKIYKTGSSASILSEGSFKSENSAPRIKNESDSSLGDSLFSYHSNRRYFGSSESCRFGYECRRCSLEGDKCSFSDNCRHDRCRNCDCSSSYFSSDFDDTQNFSRKSSTRCSLNSNNNNNTNNNTHINRIYSTPADELKPRYAENFMKHVSNVKRGQLSSKSMDEKTLYGSSSSNHHHRKSRAIGSTSTVEYSSSSDHNNTYATILETMKTTKQPRHHKEESDLVAAAATTTTMPRESSTLKRRRNKTTGTIPKMLTDTVQSQSLDSGGGGGSGNVRSQFQTIEQLDRRVIVTSTGDVEIVVADNITDDIVNDGSNNDEDEVFVSGGQSKDALKPVARRHKPLLADSSTPQSAKAPISPSKFLPVDTTTSGKQQQVKRSKSRDKQQRISASSKSASPKTNSASSKSGGSTSSSSGTRNDGSKTSMVTTNKMRDDEGQDCSGKCAENGTTSGKDQCEEQIVQSNKKEVAPLAAAAEQTKGGSDTTILKHLDEDDSCDIIDFPLPDIPTKKRESKNKLSERDDEESAEAVVVVVADDVDSATADETSKTAATTTPNKEDNNVKRQTSVEDKEVEDISMHYLNEKPTYLFGEAPNKWESTEKRTGKIEELIQRNDARRPPTTKDNVTILTIEPPASDRPGFLPVKKANQNSPPPVTPILSPPPAFQDIKNRQKHLNVDRKQGGMVFSRSFEYDNRKQTITDTSNTSKSFDYDFQEPKVVPTIRNLRRERSPNFSSLTGISPSYLTKRPAGAPPDASPIFPKAIPGSSVNNYSKLAQSNNGVQILGQYKSLDLEPGRSRRSQFTRAQTTTAATGNYSFRNFDNSTGSQRLNSCDSGARSDISNDDLDEDDDDEDQSSSLALSYKSTNSYMASIDEKIQQQQQQQQHGVIKKQRSLTPEKKYNEATITKQRSLTPDKRTLTPEHRLRPRSKNEMNSSQSSLLSSRLSSGSRASTLDRQRGRYEDARDPSSRSSSSSSYSGGEDSYRRGSSSRNSGNYRIRRSKSLQLSERSPNRQAHKVVVRVGNGPQPPPLQPKEKYSRYRANPDYAVPIKRDKPRSFDVVSYEKPDYDDFDKSKSFDDEYYNDYGRNTDRFGNDQRSYSNDHVYAPLDFTKSLPRSEVNYRHHHYEIPKLLTTASSPMYRRRENPYESIPYRRPAADLYGSSPGSDMDHPVQYSDMTKAELVSEAELVTEYLYGSKQKAEAYLNQRSREIRTATATQNQTGSCTSSVYVKAADDHPPKLISKPPIKASSIIFLGIEREMPITRQASTNTRINGTGSGATTIIVNGTNTEGHKMYVTSREPKSRSNIFKTKYMQTSASSSSSLVNKRWKPSSTLSSSSSTRWRSRSLPNTLIRSPLTAEDIELASYARSLPLQMRAVSSPALTEGPIEPVVNNNHSNSHHHHHYNNHHQDVKEVHAKQSSSSILHNTQPNFSATSGSVLQKFKKTFSNFKSSGNGKIAISVPGQPTDDLQEIKHKFGPLIWRTSKERKKTKIHRRDKCNSGDSGIQVELENDDQLVVYEAESLETSPTNASKLRRINSGKSNNASPVPKRAPPMKAPEVATLSMRSLSQPTGLNRMSNDDISDTESVSSAHDADPRSCYAEVLYSFNPGGPEELPLQKGDMVEVIEKSAGPWWYGKIKHDQVVSTTVQQLYGWFPKDFVEILPHFAKPRVPHQRRRHHHHHHHRRSRSQSVDVQQSSEDDDDDDDGPDEEPEQPTKKPEVKVISSPINCDSRVNGVALTVVVAGEEPRPSQTVETLRENAMRELIEAEVNYVKLLESLCVGFIKTLREHNEIFSNESISTIFSNIEKIWSFQQTFLCALKASVANCRVGEVFLEYQSAFMVYSQYCNSYPRALMELETYTGNKEALTLLESCRIATNLPELPLSAHLLAPIQRICRYPLHLAELVKHTQTRRETILAMDYKSMTKSEIETIDCKEIFEMALTAMRKVTEMVNEGKRHSEYLSRIQARFENFQGPPINVHSTRLFLQTDAIRMTPNLWNNTYTLFLFDRQLIYCKKDLLKRTNYIYKGRIFLDNCRILNLPDGKMFGVTLKNALRIYCDSRNKWFDFCFRSNSSKLRFLNTLSAERSFCGESLFVSELAGMDDDQFSDREYISDNNDEDTRERGIDIDSLTSSQSEKESPTKQAATTTTTAAATAFSDTLPKKSRKLSKENVPINFDYHSNSLGRRRIGNWFRKSKSTNSTPAHSPTHAPSSLLATSDSSQSSSSIGGGSGGGSGQNQQQQPKAKKDVHIVS